MASSLSKFSGVARKRSYLIRCENGERWGGGGGRGGGVNEVSFIIFARERVANARVELRSAELS